MKDVPSYRDGGELLGRIPRDEKLEFKVVRGKWKSFESIDIRLYKDTNIAWYPRVLGKKIVCNFQLKITGL